MEQGKVLLNEKAAKLNDSPFANTGIDFATRKIAAMLKPQKVIKQEGDCFTIRTLTTFRNYECSFKIGEEYQEVTQGMDNRSCQVTTLSNRNICSHKVNSCIRCFCDQHQYMKIK